MISKIPGSIQVTPKDVPGAQPPMTVLENESRDPGRKKTAQKTPLKRAQKTAQKTPQKTPQMTVPKSAREKLSSQSQEILHGPIFN